MPYRRYEAETIKVIYICNGCQQQAAIIDQESLHTTLTASTQVTCWTPECLNWGKTIDTRDHDDINELFVVCRADTEITGKLTDFHEKEQQNGNQDTHFQSIS